VLAIAMLACARQGIVLPGEGTPLPTLPEKTSTPTPLRATATLAGPTETLAPRVTATQIWTLVPPSSPTFPATPTQAATASLPIVYRVQAGDTLNTLAIRFGVTPEEIRGMEGDPPPQGLLNPGLQVVIPARLGRTTPADELMPDSEVVFSASAAAFDVAGFARDRRGYLSHAQTDNGAGSAPAMLKRLALDNSVNPRLLLALLENFGGWVTKASPTGDALTYPFGIREVAEAGFSSQLIQATNRLGIGYYGWRDASLLDLVFRDGSRLRLAPTLNAGTIAVLYYFSVDAADESDWRADVQSFMATYRRLFDDPFARVDRFEPLYYPTLTQPSLELPFFVGQRWSFTGGPHGAWEHDGARAALDFAPPSSVSGCAVSDLWVTAAAPGVVVRSENGVVVLDLDGDGQEQTGWDLLYLHIASADRVPQGSRLEEGDYIGHPSCEGGVATGTHLHIARKFNGEWMLADGPLPFVLSGWRAQAGSQPYEGALVRGTSLAVACRCASSDTLVWR
jgi:LasA protease